MLEQGSDPLKQEDRNDGATQKADSERRDTEKAVDFGEGASTPSPPVPSTESSPLAPPASQSDDSPLDRDPIPPEAALKTKLPVGLKILGLLLIVGGVILTPIVAVSVLGLIESLRAGDMIGDSISVTSALVVLTCSIAVSTIMFIVLGIRMLRNKRRNAAETARAIIVVTAIAILADLMLFGINTDDIAYGTLLVILVALTSYLDPSLSQERVLQRKLRKLDDRSEAERGDMAGRDVTGKGYITLNFFNLFWIFVVCCIIGLAIETVYHYFIFHEYQDRAGLLFGPFSPIYGCGGLLMTLALNRFHKKPLILIFLVSALIGGGFEYFVSWFMQYAFGIIAWDYSGTWLSINGRTNGQFMIMWGILGVIWVRLLLPQMLKIVNLIPWNWRYTVTTIAAVLMLTDCFMTLQSLDCWYDRMAGSSPDMPVEQFYATYFDNEFMQNRFQSMSIDPTNAIRNQ